VCAAADAGVDALITDDVPMARRALGLPELATPSPPATADLLIPRTTIRRALQLNGLAMRLVAGTPAQARITVRLRQLVVARGTIRLRAAGGRTVRIRLTTAGRRALARRRRATVTFTSVIDGRRARVRTLTLRRL